MARVQSVLDFGKSIYRGFRATRIVFLTLIVISVIPGGVLYFFPTWLRTEFAYLYVGVMGASFLLLVPQIGASLTSTLLSFWGDRGSPRTDYNDSQVRALAARMGASRIKTYITRNRWISSPFTNIFTKSVVYPEPWLKFPRLERHAIFAHEFTHERTKKRFAFEILIVIIAAFVFPYAIFFLGRPGIPIIAEIGEFALAVLALSQVSWRNEYRADLGAARIVSPEAMISVLETLQAQADWDGSSLTHPPLSSRIKRLQKLLDSPNGS